MHYEIDGRIVRGLDYYTKTAFEIVSTDLGSQDALAGGGRYDLLVKELGGKETPSVGFAAGIERLLMTLEKQSLLNVVPAKPLIFFAAADDEGKQWSLATAQTLRQHGISCEVDLLGRSLKAQMREADRQSAQYVIVAGSKELQEKKVNIKSMTDGKQTTVALDDLIHQATLLQANR